jgi:hypothetical protein
MKIIGAKSRTVICCWQLFLVSGPRGPENIILFFPRFFCVFQNGASSSTREGVGLFMTALSRAVICFWPSPFFSAKTMHITFPYRTGLDYVTFHCCGNYSVFKITIYKIIDLIL